MSSENVTQAEPNKRVPCSRYVVFAAVVIAGLFADLYSKWLVFSQLGMPGEYESTVPTTSKMPSVWWLVDNLAGFQTSLNEGALFGLGQGQIPIFTAISLLAILFIVMWLTWLKGAKSLLMTIIAGMFTAGILGNLYDRVGLHHLTWNYANDLHQAGEPVYAVRDWILIMIGNWPWPNFNIADSLMVVGVILMFIVTIFFPKALGEEKDQKNCE